MKKRKQRIRNKSISISIIVLLILAVSMAGCDNSTSGPTDSPSVKPTGTPVSGVEPTDSGDLPAPGVLPLVTEPVTLTIGIAQHALTTNYEENDFTQLVESETGVSLDFELFPSDEAAKKFSLMVTAKQKLPDILCMGFSDIERASYGSTGVFVPLNDYFENDAFYFRETLAKWASPKELEDVFKYGTSPDGNIYAYPMYSIDPGDSSALGMWINKQWLDNLDLAVPKTTDELYDTLIAFRDNDANGNGDNNDEIPLIGHSQWMGNVDIYLMNAFIYDAFAGTWGYQFNVDDNDQLYAPFITNEWREGMRYINKLSEEELLSPISFSQTQNELRAILSDPSDTDSIIGAFVGHPSPLFGGDGVPRVMEYMALPAMVGPKGISWTPNAGWFASYSTQITRSCENPQLAFRVMDAISREDISISHRYGVQGTDWEYTEEGTPSHVLEGYNVVYKQTQTPERGARWTSENNTIWHATHMAQIPPKLHGGNQKPEYANEYRDYQMRDLWYESVPLRFYSHPDKIATRLIFTQKEVDDISELQTTIRTYVDESRTRFILGDMDIENEWDSYLSTLDSMGLSHLLEVSQETCDRMSAQ